MSGDGSNQQRAESLMRDVYRSPLTGDPDVRDSITAALDAAEARGRAEERAAIAAKIEALADQIEAHPGAAWYDADRLRDLAAELAPGRDDSGEAGR